jgi:CTP:molybdopterin cytidylyltransferase MocA
MGFPKQLLVHDGMPLVRRAALAARGAGLDPVVVVLGASSTEISPALDGIESLIMVMNDDWRTGQASSIRAGLRAVETASVDGVLMMLGDQPLVDAAAIASIVSRFGSEHRIVASEYSGTVGAPALFGCEYVEELARLTGDSGAGKWLRDHASVVTRVELPEAKIDIDTPADVAALQQLMDSRSRG